MNHCNQNTLHVAFQQRERPNENGEWQVVGGFHIATCRNPKCSVFRHTVTADRHPHLGERHKRKR